MAAQALNPYLVHGGPVLPWRRRRWLCRLGLHRFAWAQPVTLVANYMRCALCGVEDGGNG